MSLLMALLKVEGLKERVRSVISSALTLHPVTNWLSYLKVDLDLVGMLDKMDEFKDGFNIVPRSGPDVPEFERKIDVVAWNVPVPDGEECKNPVCHRIFSIFGPSYTHSQLNNATHNAMGEMFGLISIPPFAQLSLIMERQQAVDHLGADTYLQLAKDDGLALPISFVTGALNRLFVPETVARTHRWLKENGGGKYACHVFEGYAHMDMFIGRNAARDVYPYLLEQLEHPPGEGER